MTSIDPPMRIQDIGLSTFLDETKELHNNFGYDNFISMVGDDFLATGDTKVDKANIARAFGVTPPTIYRWLKVLKEELSDYEPK